MSMLVSEYTGMLCLDLLQIQVPEQSSSTEYVNYFMAGSSYEYGLISYMGRLTPLSVGYYLLSCAALALTRTAIGFLCRWNSMVWARGKSLSTRELSHHTDMTMLLQDVIALCIAWGFGYSYMPAYGLAMFAGFNFTSMIVNGDILSDFSSNSILIWGVGVINTIMYVCMLPIYQSIESLDAYIKDKTKHGAFGKVVKKSNNITYNKDHCINVNLTALREFLNVHVYGEGVKNLFDRYAYCVDDRVSKEWGQLYLKNADTLKCVAEEVGIRFGKNVMPRVVKYLGDQVCASKHIVQKNGCVRLDKKYICDVVQASGLDKELSDVYASFAKVATVDKCLMPYKLNMSPANKEDFIKLVSDACRDRLVIDARKAVGSVCCGSSGSDVDYSQDIDRYLVDDCVSSPLITPSADIKVGA